MRALVLERPGPLADRAPLRLRDVADPVGAAGIDALRRLSAGTLDGTAVLVP